MAPGCVQGHDRGKGLEMFPGKGLAMFPGHFPRVGVVFFAGKGTRLVY